MPDELKNYINGKVGKPVLAIKDKDGDKKDGDKKDDDEEEDDDDDDDHSKPKDPDVENAERLSQVSASKGAANRVKQMLKLSQKVAKEGDASTKLLINPVIKKLEKLVSKGVKLEDAKSACIEAYKTISKVKRLQKMS